jgi:hypothetical protein
LRRFAVEGFSIAELLDDPIAHLPMKSDGAPSEHSDRTLSQNFDMATEFAIRSHQIKDQPDDKFR